MPNLETPLPLYLSARSEAHARDVGEQTRLVLHQIAADLKEAGSSIERALAVTVYLRSAVDFQAMNDVYRAFWPTEPPTRTTVIAELPKAGTRVQIAVVAAAPGADRVVIHPPQWMRSPNPYSYAIKSGDQVYLSGLLSRSGRDNTFLPGDVAVQTRVVMDNAGELLAAAGMSHANIVSARVFMPDLSGFRQMNEVYRSYFSSVPPPARATVGVGLTARQYAVEMTFIASSASSRAVDDGRPTSPNLSAGMRAGRHVYLSGMLGHSEASTDVASQTRATLERIRTALAAAGCSPADVVNEIVYLTDIRSHEAADAAHAAFFNGTAPARTVVQSALAVPEGLVEIMMTAVAR